MANAAVICVVMVIVIMLLLFLIFTIGSCCWQRKHMQSSMTEGASVTFDEHLAKSRRTSRNDGNVLYLKAGP